jgi:hypothetical protein
MMRTADTDNISSLNVSFRVLLVLWFWLIVTCALTKQSGLGCHWGVLHVVMRSQQWCCEGIRPTPLSRSPSSHMVVTIAITDSAFHIPHQICSQTLLLLDWNQFIYCLVLSAARIHYLLSNWCDCNNDVLTPCGLYLVKTIVVLWMYCLLEFCNHGSHITPMCTPYLMFGASCSSCSSLLLGILPHCMHKQYCLGNERNTLTTTRREWDPL